MDPRTGEIYALVSVPLVDAQTFGDSGYATRQRAVTDAYEPGSIFKAVTVSGALSEGLVKPSTKFALPPSITVGDRVIHEAHARGAESMTVSDIIAYSSNVGAVKIGMLLGRERLLKWIAAFGFGQPTGIDFPGEIGGLVPQQWSASTIGNIPMGQGIAVTPLQVAAAYSAIANGGVWVRPHLAAQVGTHVVQPGGERRVISTKVAKEVMAMLTEVVEKDGATGKGYSDYDFVASFVGIVPAQDPRLVVLVAVDQPHPYWGGTVAAPAARDIATFALQHLDIAP
jgi:cell division protein FtsI/penicillin-binding protein 2